ncbi:MAG: recombination protein NinB [Shewanella sp.]|nr:recombination protein NinB [Shewanella sp.]
MKTFSFQVQDNGKLTDISRQIMANIIATLAGKRIKISVSEWKEKRSLDQNALYWAAIVPHVRKVRFDNGDPLTTEQVHEDLLAQFAPSVTMKRMDSTVYTRPMRSKEMSVPEMAAYITAITETMAAFGFPVPTIDY